MALLSRYLHSSGLGNYVERRRVRHVILRQALAAVGERERGFATPGVAEEHALDGQRLALGRPQRARQLEC
jgi:hypothetical protein